MPPALLGGNAANGATATGSPASAARSATREGHRQDFDALLKSDSAPHDAAPKAKARPGTPDNASTPASDAPRRPASDASSDSAPAAEASPVDADKPVANEPGDDTDTDTAPWPPLGLAGLALAGVDVATAAAPPAANADIATTTRAEPLLQTLPTTASTPAATALPAPATGANATAGPIALPMDATLADDTALPKAVTDAIANLDADAPAPQLLHALHAAAELKASAPGAPFAGEPTATPHVGGDDFDDALSARIGWLADQKIGHATIKVTPHDLGLIEVRLHMDGDKVHATFSSAHADVRHALESSIPRLREMLNDQGFQLGNADVGHRHTAQDGNAGNGHTAQGGNDGDPSTTETIVSPAQLMRQRGLLDAYA